MEHYALPAQVYGAGLVFARVGAFVMLAPGLGESNIPPRLRLAFALLLTLVLYPAVRAGLPGAPATVGEIGAQITLEIMVGLILGALLRLFLGALAVTAEIVSLQTTLSFAQTTNPLQAQPTVTIGAFLALIGVTLIFATDLHQLFIGAMVRSYAVFRPGRGLPVADLATLMIRTFGDTFALGVQLAAPLLVFGLVFNVAVGLVGRAMPQFQVFFAATPLTLLLGLSIFALGLGVLGTVWVDHLRSFTNTLAGVG